jgi:hypothetical protein
VPSPDATGAGYSGTPLGRKLGFRPGMRVFADAIPVDIRHQIRFDLDGDPDWCFAPEAAIEAAHIFVTEREAMATKLAALRTLIVREGYVWVSWPKRASKVDTDITEAVIRDVALPIGFVDVKVCAVDEMWSGLKLVIRKELR